MFQEQANKMLIDNARAMAALCKQELIPLPAHKDATVREHMALFLALSKSEKEKMLIDADNVFYGAKEAKDIIELAKAANAGKLEVEGYATGTKIPIHLGAVAMLKGSSAVSNFILEKSAFWGDTSGLFPQYIQTISSAAQFAQEGMYDMGYLLAFNTVDGRSAKAVYLENLVFNLRYYKLKESQKVPVTGGESENKTLISPLRYGAGKFISQWYEGATFGTTTAEVNTQVRMTSAAGKSKAAYQTLLRQPILASNRFVMETLNSDAISNIILNLNKKIMFMLNAARKAEVPLLISPTTPILVYYHPDWTGTIKLIQNRSTSNIVATTSNPDLISLDYNIVFVPTFEFGEVKGGAFKDSGKVDENFFPIMEPCVSNEFGVKIIIPKQKNQLVIFQDLFPDVNTNREEFMRNYVWEERHATYLNPLQEGHLYSAAAK
jgi:hypothetical protein